MTPTTTTRSMPPFPKEAVSGPLSDDVLHQFFTYYAAIFDLLQTEGDALLQQKEPLNFQEWSRLLEMAFCAWNTLQSSSIQAFFERVIERGSKVQATW